MGRAQIVFACEDGQVLVSCIMPTRGRSQYAHMAVDCFLRQTWLGKELIILDDLDARSFSVVPDFPNVQYHISERRKTIGEKRNRCCELAHGDVIAHWDDDDYSAPERLSNQVDSLTSSGAMLTGYSSMAAQLGEEVWMFTGRKDHPLGTSFMYRREFWQKYPFRDVQQGEDSIMLGHALREGQVVSVPADHMMLARIHGGNTATKDPSPESGWTRIKRAA